MSKKNKVLTILIVLIMIVGTTIVFASSVTPGSSDDPLVSKSYVDSKSTYQAVMIKSGQTLTGDEGTEIILRSGEATAIDNGANGISDITSGKDLMTGTQVDLNHLLLVPRNDGRGIHATTDGWVMIRGQYSIK